MKEAEDSITQEKMRMMIQIPKEKGQDEAFSFVYTAAHYLRRDKDIQNEALPGILSSLEPHDWSKIDEFANNSLDIDKDNVRANWLLAQFDFKQPLEGTDKATDSKNLRRERV